MLWTRYTCYSFLFLLLPSLFHFLKIFFSGLQWSYLCQRRCAWQQEREGQNVIGWRYIHSLSLYILVMFFLFLSSWFSGEIPLSCSRDHSSGSNIWSIWHEISCSKFGRQLFLVRILSLFFWQMKLQITVVEWLLIKCVSACLLDILQKAN